MDAPQQLYLFEVPAASRCPAGRVGALSLRPDHVLLSLMFGLIGLSVIFALGVERGRQVAQVEERALLAPREPEVKTKASTSSVEPETPSPRRESTPNPVAPKKPAPKAAVKVAKGPSQFAIQVVSYNQPTLAQQELQRLQQRGERAFLVKREGRTVLYVGPFPSKDHAAGKLTALRRHYRDCFVKGL